MNLKEVLRIKIEIESDSIISLSGKKTVTFIPFKGTAESEYFTGKVLPGGVDVQIAHAVEKSLSARYILEGTDIDNQSCKIYIENNGYLTKSGTPLFKTTPKIITNSQALDFLNDALLVGEGMWTDEGLVIIIYNTVI